MSDEERKELEFIIANLRHTYAILARGVVPKPVELADGLLAPSIVRLEKLMEGKSGGCSTQFAKLLAP